MKKKQTATAFVLGMPDTPAKDVVLAAKKNGIKLSEQYVYVIRSNANRKAGKTRKSGAVRVARSGNAEAQLRSAIAEVGLARARAVLAEVERTFG